MTSAITKGLRFMVFKLLTIQKFFSAVVFVFIKQDFSK